MLKSAMMLGVTLCVGMLLGVAFAILGPFSDSPAHRRPESSPAPTRASIDATSQADASSTSVAGSTLTLAPNQGDITTPILQQLEALSIRLDEESDMRQRLQVKVTKLEDHLQRLGQRLDELAEPPSKPADAPPRVGGSRQINPATLVEAGFSQDEADWVSTLWEHQQLDLLYLRDQASREGWLNSPRYDQAVRDLRNGDGSMRDEMGLNMYDRFLFATGQSNRVVLHSVIKGSPGQTIGLQPGDTIFTYDSRRILSVNDLQAATTSGEPDVPVVIEVDRGGQLVEFEIARGPIGVTLRTRRVEP